MVYKPEYKYRIKFIKPQLTKQKDEPVIRSEMIKQLQILQTLFSKRITSNDKLILNPTLSLKETKIKQATISFSNSSVDVCMWADKGSLYLPP